MQEPSQQQEKVLNARKKQVKALGKYSGMAFQMGATIGLFAFIGQWIDGYFSTEKPYWTIFFSLFGVFAALYYFIKDVTKMDKEK